MKGAARLRARRAQAAGAALALASALMAFRGGARQAMKFTRFAEAGDEDEEDEDEGRTRTYLPRQIPMT